MRGVDPRPSSPGQVAAGGAVLVALAWFGLLGPASLPFLYIGLALLLVAGISWAIKPQRRTAYWRGQEIDLSGNLSWWERVYYLLYRG